jgi:ABC-type glycerol-3-phosphate transport system substrate-binding protein
MRVSLTLLLSSLLLVLTTSCQDRQGGTRSDGRVTLTFWHSFVSSTIPALEELLERFEQENPGIRIEAQYIPTGDALVQKLVTAVQSGSAPDISWVRSHYMGDLVEADAIHEMAPFIDGPNGLTEEEMADIYPALIQYASWQGTMYSMPMEATNLGILYNKDHFREAGLDPERPPQTWAQMREYVQKLTRDENGDGKMERVGFMVPAVPADGPQGAYMMWQWTPFLWQAGGYLIDEAQTEVLFGGEAGVRALSFWKDLYELQNLRNFTNVPEPAFVSGQASMMLDGPWSLPRYPRTLANIDWGIAWLPEGPQKRATVVAGEYLAIFKQSEHPDEAWTFLKWILQPEVQAFWAMASGYLPVRRSVLEVPAFRSFLDENPGHKAYVEQMQFAQSQRPMDFHAVEIQRNLARALEQAMVGGRDPAAVLQEAARASNALLVRVSDLPKTGASTRE